MQLCNNIKNISKTIW